MTTSIEARLFALRVLLTDLPKIQTDQALSSKQKQTPFCLVRNVVNNFSLSVRLFETCSYDHLAGDAGQMKER